MNASNSSVPTSWQEHLAAKLTRMKYGSIQLVVHDGKVTQIEATEKFRLQVGPAAPLDRTQS